VRCITGRGDESTRDSVILVQFNPFAHLTSFRELVLLGMFASPEVESVPDDVVGIGVRRRG
jgi:hypothetical protein